MLPGEDLALLRNNADALARAGRQLTYRDWRSHEHGIDDSAPVGRLVTAETMRRRYGSWNEAKIAAGVSPSRPGPARAWTKRVIVFALIQYRVEFGWFPTKRDLERSTTLGGEGGLRRFPDPKTVRSRLGSLARAQRIAAWLYARYPERWQTIPLG
jgi:hypothetical protein